MNRPRPSTVDDLFEQESQAMLRVLRGRWRLDGTRAQDVLVDTWEQCRRIEGRLMGQPRPAAFAMGVLENCARRDRSQHARLAARARKCAEPAELDRLADPVDAERRLMDAHTWAQLSQGVEELRIEHPQAAQALELRHLQGLSFQEIQTTLGLTSQAAARGLELRARAWLRTWWTRRTGEAPPPRVHVLLLLSTPWRAPEGSSAGLLGGGGALMAAGGLLGGILLVGGGNLALLRAPVLEPATAVVAQVESAAIALPAPVPATPGEQQAVEPVLPPPEPSQPVPPPPAQAAPEENTPDASAITAHLALPATPATPGEVPSGAALGPAMQAYGDARERLLAARDHPEQLGAARRAYEALLSGPLPSPVEALARVDRAELAVREGDPRAAPLLRELLSTRTDPVIRATLIEMLALTLAQGGACDELQALPDGRGGLTAAPREVRQACQRTSRRKP